MAVQADALMMGETLRVDDVRLERVESMACGFAFHVGQALADWDGDPLNVVLAFGDAPRRST